jgi:hypothetical protein
MTTYDTARAYIDAGLSVFPVRADGSKAPAIDSWNPYRQRRATDDELSQWYHSGGLGIAICGGPISGGLEVLDFDDRQAYRDWGKAVVKDARDQGVTWPDLPTVETPTHGIHVLYRHDGEQRGSHHLALDEGRGVLIETRGSGGYVVAPGSPAACHPSGREYVLRAGDLRNVPTITPEVRAFFHAHANALDRSPAPVYRKPTRTVGGSPSVDGDRPGDVFNRTASWDALLVRHGWKLARVRGQTSDWWRPGKERGSISATVNHYGSDCLHVFSSNAGPLVGGVAYTKFAAYAILDFQGDFVAAAVDLLGKGYRTEGGHMPQGSWGGTRRLLTERMAMSR